MKTRFGSIHQPRRKSCFLDRPHYRFQVQCHNRRVKKIQLIYAHFGPPVVFSVTE